jgi:uncharacterized OsmC-like protein
MAIENNGVQLSNIEALVEAVKANSRLANVRFAATSRWLGGTKTEVTITTIEAGGETITRPDRRFTLIVDEPPQLGGTDEHPNPVEYLAAGLCGCLTAGIATNAALFQTPLDTIEIDVEMDYDLRNVLALDRTGPKNVTELRYTVRLAGPGAKEKMVRAKQTIDGKSPVRNTLELPLRVVKTDVIVHS